MKRKTKRKQPRKEMDFGLELSPEALLRADVLRVWRRKYAKQNDIPAFMVFSDKTLKDLATKAPDTQHQLSDVYGLGEKKINTFGAAIIETLQEIPS